MKRVNTTVASLCVLGVACTAPTPEEPARETRKATRRLLGEGPASLVADVGAKPESALVRYPTFLTTAGTTLFFSANDESSGPELWKLAPTGPVLVADIAPGALGSSPSNFFHMRGLTYFSASDGQSGVELWRTDGTTAGTFLLKDIVPGRASSQPSQFAELNGWIYFSANDGSNGTELWRTDGTPEGTVLVRDIMLGSGKSDPLSFTELGGKLYFTAIGPGGTRQLWRTDGTAVGTIRIGENLTVTDSPGSRGLVRSGRVLFFAGNDGTTGDELWKTDGTEAGTVRVKDIAPGAQGSAPARLTAFGNAVYFVATDGVSGQELWKTDGTGAGTSRVLELVPGNNTVEKPDSLVATSTRLFFMMRDDSNTESSLHATDGTAAGTLKLVDFKSLGGKGPLQMKAHGDKLYFTGNEPTVGPEVWTSDGTIAGTRRIGNDLLPGSLSTAPAPHSLTVVGDTVYFVAAAPGTGSSLEDPGIPTLWKTKGDASNTSPAGNDLSPTQSSNPMTLAAWNGALYFTTYEQDVAAKLWRSDGTSAGTEPLADIIPANAHIFTIDVGLSTLTPLNNALYFAVMYTMEGDHQLWRTDGTASPSGTYAVTNKVKPVGVDAAPIEITAHGGVLFFAGQGASNGVELWKSDGTDAGTTLVKDIAPGGASSLPSRFTPIGNTLFFLARDAAGGRELWKTDGTTANTVRVTDIRDGLGNASIASLAGVMNGFLYFTANKADTGIELWKTNGTTTSLVKDIAPGVVDSGPSIFAVLGNTLYFTADDGVSGRELWRTDGTAAGTVRVKDIAAHKGSSNPLALTVLGSTLYFTADDGVSGQELWKSNGTEAGTVRVKDIQPGKGNGVLTESIFTLPNEKLILFAANDGEGGTELWRSDGTEAGTFVLHDIAPWQLSSNPAGFTFFGNSIAFSASDGRHGREPWLMPLKLLTNSTPPSISCPANQVVEAQQFLGAQVDFPEASASDDTALPPAITYSRGPGGFFPFGTTQVIATARDTAGLVDTCRFTVTVRDTTPPEPICPANATVEAVSAKGAEVTFSEPRATDTVTRNPIISVSHRSGNLYPQGNTMVTVTATDESKNSKQCTFTIQVRDTTASVVTCPADQIVEAENANGATASWPPAEATDAVSQPVITYDHVSGSRFPFGNTPVTATATDVAGNVSSCTFQVRIRDTKAPTLQCPAPVQVEATGPAGARADFAVTDVVDNVSTVSVSTDRPSGDSFPIGETPVRVRAEDASGNVAECDFSVQVLDTLSPLLTCPQDVNVEEGPVAVELPRVSVTDRVTTSPSVTFSPESGSVFQLGDTPVEVTATDDAGNVTRCTFNVHIQKEASGCSTASGRAGATGWMGLLSLLAFAVRRKTRSSQFP